MAKTQIRIEIKPLCKGYGEKIESPWEKTDCLIDVVETDRWLKDCNAYLDKMMRTAKRLLKKETKGK